MRCIKCKKVCFVPYKLSLYIIWYVNSLVQFLRAKMFTYNYKYGIPKLHKFEKNCSLAWLMKREIDYSSHLQIQMLTDLFWVVP